MDFVTLAEAFGCVGIRASKREEVRPALERAMAVEDRPAIIDFRVEDTENCWPMVAPGKPSHQMLGTYETLKGGDAKPQYRHVSPDEEAEISLS
jgi:thiamine pyrophosphate-dependent acetolactate synthase large subunit-like protein